MSDLISRAKGLAAEITKLLDNPNLNPFERGTKIKHYMWSNVEEIARVLGELCQQNDDYFADNYTLRTLVKSQSQQIAELQLLLHNNQADNARLRLKISDLEARLADKVLAEIEQRSSSRVLLNEEKREASEEEPT